MITLIKTFPAKSIKRLAVSLENSEPFNKVELQTLFDQIISIHIVNLVSQIQEAIKNEKQVRILKYQSARSLSLTERLMERVVKTVSEKRK